jgi:hypothetical protein
MVSGNVLFDRPFIKWYLNIFKNIVLDNEDKYVITFIDHNMNYITLPDYCYLLVKKKNYDIINDVSVSEATANVSVSEETATATANVSVCEATANISVCEATANVSVSVSEATATATANVSNALSDALSEATEANI